MTSPLPLLLLALGVPAATPPGSQALSPPDPRSALVDRIFADFDQPGSPGCAVGVLEKGRVVHQRAYGMADLEHGVPLTPETPLLLGSVSKQFTGAAVGLLAVEGALSLDDELGKHVPGMPRSTPPLRLRHLLDHTSGLADYQELLQVFGDPPAPLTDADVLGLLGRVPPGFAPGEAFLYSNSNYFLLGRVVGSVAGRTLAAFARERLFEPLGMRHTEFYDDHGRLVPGRALGYAPRAGGAYGVVRETDDVVGPTGLFSTIVDLLAWERGLAEGKLPGGQKLVSLLREPGRLADGRSTRYGFGNGSTSHRGRPLAYHAGSEGAFRAFLYRYPADELSIACLCNHGGARPVQLAAAIADVYLPPPAAPSTSVPPEADLARLAATYLDPFFGQILRIAVEDGGLRASGAVGSALLRPSASRRFRTLEAREVELEFDSDGKRVQIISNSSFGPLPTTFERVTAPSLTREQLARYAGRYRNAKIPSTLRIRLAEKGLVLGVEHFGTRLEEGPLEPVGADAFVMPGGLLRWTKGRKGAPGGLEVIEARARGVKYERVGP